MLRGMTTITYFAGDVPAAVTWYTKVLGVDPYDRLISLGATPHDKATERGPGFITASVIDPFGNVLGIMFNQHYLDIAAARRGA